jgi:biotin operon repressor
MPKKPRYDDETFVRAWHACESQVQLAQRLGVKESTVCARARALRLKGIQLPKQRVAP